MNKSTLANIILRQIAILTLVSSVLWVGFGIYHALSQPAELEVSKEVSRPISAQINGEAIEDMKARFQLKDEVDKYLEENLGGLIAEEEKEATGSGEEEVIEATGSGEVIEEDLGVEEPATESGGL